MEFAPKLPVPVFPLPGVVLFPHVAIPLHIFELRYRTMVRDALSSERLIAMSLLKPGWEAEYLDRPEYHELGCLGRIETVEWLTNDRYNLTLLGLHRVKFGPATREFPYRAARAELLPEAPYDETDPLVEMERHALFVVRRQLAAEPTAGGAFALAGDAEAERYDAMVNALAFQLPLEAERKQALLRLDSVIERGRIVRALAERTLAALTRRETPEGDEGKN